MTQRNNRGFTRLAIAAYLMSTVLLALIAVDVLVSSNDNSDVSASAQTQIEESLSKVGKVGSISASPWPGLYQVKLDNKVVYSNESGSMFIAGDMYANTSDNLTEKSRKEARAEILKALPKSDAIIYPAKGGKTKHVLWVFTDTSCPFCRKFHDSMDKYNAMGIEVRYLAFPREGRSSKAWNTEAAIWCSSNRRKSLNEVMAGGEAPVTAACDASPVQRTMTAGLKSAINGTPAVVLSDGSIIGGYLSPDAIKDRLN